jgi:transposase
MDKFMSFITNNQNQLHLFGYTLSDLVPPKAKCRLVLDLVKKLKLKKLYHRYSSQGNHAYEPSIMLAIWFYSYSMGETSTRKIEELCRRDLHFMYISSNLQPDHTSLSRFRKDHLDLMQDYFVQLVLLIRKEGLSDFKDIAIDGSKIQASCSSKKSKRSDDLSRKLKSVRRQISEYMERCDRSDQEENQDILSLRKRIKQLQELEQTLMEREKQLSERKDKIKAEYRENHKINITEPDARMMDKVNGRKKSPGYNAQISVDMNSQFIAANDVVCDANDQNQFSSQHNNLEENLGKDSDREYTTDSGYHSNEQLEYIEKNKIKAVIADPNPHNRSFYKENATEKNAKDILKEKDRFDRSDFIYDKEKDFYWCPKGKKLTFERKYNRKGFTGSVYKCDHCRGCPYRKECLPENNKSGFRRIHRDHKEHYAEAMYIKTQTECGRVKLKRRACSAEPVLGNLKENLGFRRFNLRGLVSVKGEFNLMCIAHNINKMYILFYFLLWRYLATFYYVKERKLIKTGHLNFKYLFMTLYSCGYVSLIFNETATA